MTREHSLHNAQIVVTRPRQQGGKIKHLLESSGATVLHCPCIKVHPLLTSANHQNTVGQLAYYQMLVFISQNAVEWGLQLLQKNHIPLSQLPAVGAIGKSTAALLNIHGIQVLACPELPSSEAFTQTPTVEALPPQSRVLIFRGRGGKEVLAQRLRKRNIQVDYAEVYVRQKPELLSIPEHMPSGAPFDLIMFTSRDCLENFFSAIPASRHAHFRKIQLLLGSQSMLPSCAPLNPALPPVIAHSPLDQDMFEVTVRWWETRSAV